MPLSTPEEARTWLAKLEVKLGRRLPEISRYEAYYDGEHKLAFATSRFKEAFGNLFSAFADNWCDLIVNASVERLRVEGFRFGGKDEQGDQDAWAIWQANGLDADSTLAHTEAVKCGPAYALVAPGDGDLPQITVEHPREVIVANVAGNRRRRAAALKKWIDDDRYAMATVYLPDVVYRFRSRERLRAHNPGKIDWVERPGEPFRTPHDFGVVPMVPLPNNPTMFGVGQSDLKKAIPIQDGVNKLCSDMLVSSEFGAFRQRWATGLEVPTDEVTGQPDPKFLSAISRVWTVEDERAKFGEFGATDLGNYVKAIEMLIQHLAAQTRTPPHYLLGQSGAFPSGESLKATETGLVAKVEHKQLIFGEGWEEVMRLAFRARGDAERASQMDAETLWRDPESRSEGERVDALVKMGTLGVPQEELWRKWGASPQEIIRWKEMQAEETIRNGLAPFLGQADEQGVDPTLELAGARNGNAG